MTQEQCTNDEPEEPKSVAIAVEVQEGDVVVTPSNQRLRVLSEDDWVFLWALADLHGMVT